MASTIRLTVAVPEQLVVETLARKVKADGADGSFCLLPNHIDYATPLQTGLLSFVDETGEEVFVAVDRGMLVKQGTRVRVSVRRAICDRELDELERTVRETYRRDTEEEREARRASARLQANFVRRFLDLKEEAT